jgi:hypothetical protein
LQTGEFPQSFSNAFHGLTYLAHLGSALPFPFKGGKGGVQ